LALLALGLNSCIVQQTSVDRNPEALELREVPSKVSAYKTVKRIVTTDTLAIVGRFLAHGNNPTDGRDTVEYKVRGDFLDIDESAINDCENIWEKCIVNDTLLGYLWKSDGISVVDGVAYARKNVNIRSGPGTRYKKIGLLKQSEGIRVLGVSNDWTVVSQKGDTSYIRSDYLVSPEHYWFIRYAALDVYLRMLWEYNYSGSGVFTYYQWQLDKNHFVKQLTFALKVNSAYWRSFNVLERRILAEAAGDGFYRNLCMGGKDKDWINNVNPMPHFMIIYDSWLPWWQTWDDLTIMPDFMMIYDRIGDEWTFYPYSSMFDK